MGSPPDPQPFPARFQSCERIEAFVACFNARHLPKSEWDHHAHLVVGLWHALRLPADQALDALRDRIRAHNDAVGTVNSDVSGYHETITRLYLLGILGILASMGARGPLPPLPDLVQALLQSELADRNWPRRFYSRERLFTPEARNAWIEPDLAPPPSPAPAASPR
jgi:hypothetical protein